MLIHMPEKLINEPQQYRRKNKVPKLKIYLLLSGWDTENSWAIRAKFLAASIALFGRLGGGSKPR